MPDNLYSMWSQVIKLFLFLDSKKTMTFFDKYLFYLMFNESLEIKSSYKCSLNDRPSKIIRYLRQLLLFVCLLPEGEAT